MTQPEALREAAWIAIGRFARSIARDDAEVAPPKYLLDAIAALEAHGAPEPIPARAKISLVEPWRDQIADVLIAYAAGGYDFTGNAVADILAILTPADGATPQAAIGAAPSSPKTLLNARTMEEAKDALRGHQAQAVASSPTTSLGHQTESDSGAVQRPVGDGLGDEDLLFSNPMFNDAFKIEFAKGAINFRNRVIANLRTRLAETQRSSHTAGSDENKSGGAEPPALTDDPSPEAALARHIAAAKALLPPGTCVGAVGTRCLMKDR